MDHILFIHHPAVDTYLVIMNNDAMNMSVYVRICLSPAFNFLDHISRSGIAGSYGSSV